MEQLNKPIIPWQLAVPFLFELPSVYVSNTWVLMSSFLRVTWHVHRLLLYRAYRELLWKTNYRDKNPEYNEFHSGRSRLVKANLLKNVNKMSIHCWYSLMTKHSDIRSRNFDLSPVAWYFVRVTFGKLQKSPLFELSLEKSTNRNWLMQLFWRHDAKQQLSFKGFHSKSIMADTTEIL